MSGVHRGVGGQAGADLPTEARLEAGWILTPQTDIVSTPLCERAQTDLTYRFVRP
jgi:hypothetical protein